MLDGQRVFAPARDVILVEHVAQEVAVVQLVQQAVVDVGRQLLEPVGIVTAKRDVQCHDILHLLAVHFTVAHCGTGHREAMQERLPALLCRAVEIAAFMACEEVAQPGLGLRCVLRGHLQQQMMFIALAELAHALGQRSPMS
ncbi:hypothetical protein G6F59_014960 [Rhizopus arrhizus]|nr:hypothetical protein G6F59_014960 [Rhizopus arrhizus]